MFYVKHDNGKTANGGPVLPNQSHLHKVTSPTRLPQSTARKPFGKTSNGDMDIAVDSSVVSNFLKTIAAKENAPVRNQSHLFKSQAALQIGEAKKPTEIVTKTKTDEVRNHLGLRKTPSREAEVEDFRNHMTLRKVTPPGDAKCKEEEKWKVKYEEAERRRKELLTESQRGMRDKTKLEKQVLKLQTDYNTLTAVCTDRTDQLDKLRKVSEQVYQDYDKLNMKYETETTTLHKALEVASKWYKENKKLKRESVALRSGATVRGLDDVVDGEAEVEAEDQTDEMTELRKTVQDLSNQVGQLQAELNRARLQEFEAQEQYINLTQALDEQRLENARMSTELRELRLMKDKFESVTYIVHDEMKALMTERDKATETATRLQREAHQAQKERNVLAHQSSLLMGDISSNETLVKVLQEVEELKRRLEEETQRHAMEVQALEARLEDTETEPVMELMEEKLKLAESELQLALQRAEAAEEASCDLRTRVNELESQLEPHNSCPNRPAGPPPPPPPPPLPPPMPFLDKNMSTPQRQVRVKTGGDSLEDMANLLGIQRQPKPANVQGGAIDEIINEIKGGKFTLKATEKQKSLKKEETPPAVQEMLSIIGTLKRRPRNSRPPADVQL